MLEKYLKNGMRLALAVSGGKDSMVMLDKILRLKERFNLDVRVVNVNHKIRMNGGEDSRFVADYCKKRGVKCEVYEVDVPEYAAKKKLSLETAAREMRYAVLSSAAKNSDYVCLAHHMNDNAETVLMHILRGSGARGAAGIKPVSNRFFRPLLDETREEIDKYAFENDIPFVYDETNGQIKYTRNFVRHEIMPLLNKVNPDSVRAIISFSESVKADDDCLNDLADVSGVIFSEGRAEIPCELLNGATPVAARIIYKCFNRLGIYRDIEKKHVEKLLRLAKSNCGEKEIALPFDYRAVKTYTKLVISRKCAEQIAESLRDLEIPFRTGETEFGNRTVTVIPVSGGQVERDALLFDADKLPDGVVLRTRREGDMFTKFGGGTKKLKEYLIDKKIPRAERDGLILGAKDSEVFFIAGVEISDKIKLDASTKNSCMIDVDEGLGQKEEI